MANEFRSEERSIGLCILLSLVSLGIYLRTRFARTDRFIDVSSLATSFDLVGVIVRLCTTVRFDDQISQTSDWHGRRI